MIGENKYNEAIEQRAFEQSNAIYFRKNPEAELEKEKIAIARRLKEINTLQRNEEKREQLRQVELLKRKVAYRKFIQEKELSARQINLFYQNTEIKINPSGI